MAKLIIDFFTNYWFWVFLGAIVGSIIGIRNLLKAKIEFPVAVMLVTIMLYGGMFGTRILDVLINNPSLVFDDFLDAIAFWKGQLSAQGFVLGFFFVLFAAPLLKLPAWETTGAITPGITLGHAFGKVGCFFNKCCFGVETNIPWCYDLADRGCVHPSPVYESLSEILLFSFLQWVYIKKPDFRRYLFPWYGFLFGFHRFFLEFLRAEPGGPELIRGLRVYHVICILMMSVFSIMFFCLLKKRWAYLAAALVAASTLMLFVVFKP